MIKWIFAVMVLVAVCLFAVIHQTTENDLF